MHVGAEFNQCPDGSWVKGRATPQNCPPSGGGGGNPGGPVSPGSWGPGIDWPTYTPGGGGGNGNPGYTPPGGGNGNPGGYTPPGGGNGNPGGYNPPGGGYPPPFFPPPAPTIPGPALPPPAGCAPACNICPEDQKRYVLPFIPAAGFTAAVAAGQLVTFTGKPQKLFAPDRLIIASSIGPFFDIVNLIIANIPQSLAQGNVSAEMFSEVATYVMMSFDQAYPGIEITITAQNKSSVTQTFQAQLIGEAVG